MPIDIIARQFAKAAQGADHKQEARLEAELFEPQLGWRHKHLPRFANDLAWQVIVYLPPGDMLPPRSEWMIPGTQQ